MREQEQQFEPGRDPEATVIRPLFDEDAAVVARPVIPLDDKAMDEGMGAYVETGTAPPAYTRAWKRRNQPTIMLVVAALFAGAIVGITGLYFFQRSLVSDTAVKTAAPEQPQQQQQQAPAASEEAPPTVEPPSAKTTQAAPPSVVAEVAAEPTASAAGEVAAGADASARDRVKVNDGEGAPREAERAAPAARRPEDDDEEEEARPAAVRRGRRGDDDDDARAGESSRARPRVYDTQGPAPAGSAAERRAAREEDRLRRMRRERRRGRGEAYMVDSIRGIFEGGRNSPPR